MEKLREFGVRQCFSFWNSSPFKKVLRMLRLTMFCLFLSLQMMAMDVYSQQTRLTLNLVNQRLEDVLRVIEDKSEFYFFYNRDMIDVDRRVNIDVTDQSITKIMNELLKGSNVRYEVVNRQIILSNLETSSALLQTLTVSGKVTDSSGASLPGVTVVIKGTTKGTVTGDNGSYELLSVPSDQVLVFSFVGMKTVEIPVNGKTIINAVLEEESIGLGEVVAIGYGTMKKSDLTGSVGVISSEELVSRPITSFEEGLQGRLAGVAITQNSSAPGGGISVKIRGNTSILNGSEPLYVIDGFPVGQSMFSTDAGRNLGAGTAGAASIVDQNALATINPSDIESIEVLKDASAAAIYGVRGANGVILITTKRGKKGAPKFTYDGYVGVQVLTDQIEMMDAREYMTMYNLNETTSGYDPIFSQEMLDNPPYDTDWQKMITRNARIQSHQISASGGTEKVSYNLSGGYFGQDGVVLGSDFSRYSGRVNLDIQASKKLKIANSLNISRVINNAANTEGEATNGIMSVTLAMSPLLPVYKEDGTYYTNADLTDLYGLPNAYGTINPMAYVNETMDKSVNTRIMGTLFGEYSFTDDLKLKISIGADIDGRDRHVFHSSKYDTSKAISDATVSTVNRTSLLNENTLNYTKKIGKSSFNTLLGWTVQKEDTEFRSIKASGFASDITGPYDLGGGSITPAVSSNYAEFNIMSFIGRINYNYDDRYLLTLTGRRDGSSKFASGKRWATFPSVAFAWRINNESFMEDLNTSINNLKLRLGYGIVGNQELPAYQSLALLQVANYAFGNSGVIVNGFSPYRVEVPNLTWELTEQTNLGLDLSLLNDRFSFSLDYYVKKTKDLLLQVILPETAGITEASVQNLGEMENKGWEFSGEGLLISNSKLSWRMGVNISANKNKLVSMGDPDIYGDLSFTVARPTYAGGTLTSYVRIGEPIGVFYGYKTDGLYKTQEEADAGQNLRPGVIPGMIKYVDTSKDGVLDENDRTLLGSPFPDFIYGINSSLQYGDFELRVFLQGQEGGKVYNMMRRFYSSIGAGSNGMKETMDTWTPDNINAKWPAIIADPPVVGGGGNMAESDWYLEDASYLRCREVTLTYNIPGLIFNSIKGSVYVTGQNLFTITKYTGYNPDTNGRAGVTGSFGYDVSSYPLSKSFLLGLKINF